MDLAKNRLNIDVDGLANKNIKRRRKRDLNQPVHYEINNKKVAVFTPEFLEANRVVDDDLRKLRRLNNDYDEHNSVLLKYIESLNNSCDQIGDELKGLTNFKQQFSHQLNLLKSEVKEKYNLDIKNEKEN